MLDTDRQGFGRRLKEAREAAGLSQAGVSEKLRLNTATVDALERENLDVLPAPAYVRGYIRAYAQLLDCPVEELLARYNAYATDEPNLARPVGLEPQQEHSGAMLRWGSVGVVIVLLALAGVWLYDYLRSQPEWLESATGGMGDTAETTIDLELDKSMAGPDTPEMQFPGNQPEWMNSPAGLSEPPASEPLKSGSTGGTEAGDGASTPGRESPSANEPDAQEPDGANTQAGNDTSQSDLVPAGEPRWEQSRPDTPAVPEGVDPDTREVLMAPQGADSLKVELDGPSWVEAFDANGYRLIYGLFDRTDNSVVVRGKAPFQVVLGDATQVDVSINDAPLELDAYIRSNKTARLLVEPQGRRAGSE